MADNGRSYSPEEKYELIGKLIEEVKLRRYSYQTGKSYISIVKDFFIFRQNAKRVSAILHNQKQINNEVCLFCSEILS
ncbi:MAG: hypothetical protein QXR48_03790 [Candidatus Woesearchaeota archaeon]